MEFGRYWQTPDGSRKRIYIDEAPAWAALGWDFSFYNTGNVCSATEDGKSISNASAKNLIHGLRESSLYYDLTDGKFHWKQSYNRDFDREMVVRLIGLIRGDIEKMAQSLNGDY